VQRKQLKKFNDEKQKNIIGTNLHAVILERSEGSFLSRKLRNGSPSTVVLPLEINEELFDNLQSKAKDPSLRSRMTTTGGYHKEVEK